ncbi:MAG TPA: hypothetical protein VG603_12045 [Chitinophagales bacterium]|nr:hypothetical protein [Chitinophagales bacterium]
MKKLLTILVITALTAGSCFAQKLSKEEKKQLKSELKGYMKNLESYKASKENTKATADSSDAQIGRLREDLKNAQAQVADLETKVSNNESELKATQEENEKLKEKSKEAEMRNPPATGTIYKVQLGMYKGLDFKMLFDKSRYIGFEDVDGLTRYVISYFTDEDMAKDLAADLKKLGIKDAFVAKYIDGQRVYEWNDNPKYKGKKAPETLQEALEMQEQSKHHGKKKK